MTLSNDTKRRELEGYLYSNLDEITNEIGDETEASYCIALVLAFHEKDIDPVRLDFYLSHLPLNQVKLAEALSYLYGAEFLNPEGIESFGLDYAIDAGREAKKVNSPLYATTKKRIEDFRNEFWT